MNIKRRYAFSEIQKARDLLLKGLQTMLKGVEDYWGCLGLEHSIISHWEIHMAKLVMIVIKMTSTV